LNLNRSIAEQGFAIIPEVLRPDELTKLFSDLSQSDLPRSKAGIRHAMKLPSVAKTAHDSRVLGMARAILGAEAFPFRATLFDKSPTANWLVVWHQDTAPPA